MNVHEFRELIEDTVKAKTLAWYENLSPEDIQKWGYKVPQTEDEWEEDDQLAVALDEFYEALNAETQTSAGVLKVLQHEIINGDEQYVVFQLGNEYFKVSGYWSSYSEDNSLHHDGRWSKVEPVQRMVTFYEDINA